MAIFLLSLLMALTCIPVVAESRVVVQEAQYNQLDHQRQLYREALDLIRKGRWQSLRKHRQKLIDYPLYPYLIYADLIADLRYSRRSEVDDYLHNYKGTVKARHLRSKWLDYLVKRKYWTTYIEFYNQAEANTSQQCHFQFARLNRLEADAKEPAYASALALWNSGKSQPRACDKLFSLLVAERRISESLAWQRFNKALLNHQYVLARYLQRFLKSKDYKSLAKQYYKVDRNPQIINEFTIFNRDTEEELGIIEHALVHLARKDSHATLSAWSHYQQTHEFSHAARSKIVSAIIKGLYREQLSNIGDAYFLDHLQMLNQTTDGAMTEWRIRKALKARDWLAVQRWIKHLPSAQRQQTGWRYWAIRSMEAVADTTSDPKL
jgi:soluble lytic murein transglycosylase